MKKLNLLIVANNTPWKSWPEKVKALQNWFMPKVNFTVTRIETNLHFIPFVRYNPGTDQAQYKQPLGIDRDWYDQHVTPLAAGYDIVLFILPTAQWPSNGDMRGWRTDRDQGPVELQAAAGEHERLIWNNKDAGDMFQNLARHEIMHALFMLTGQPDTTHYWWDREQLGNALEDLSFPEPHVAEELTRMQKLINVLSQLIALITLKKTLEADIPPPPEILTPEIVTPEIKKPTIYEMCKAIQEFEGWFAPGDNSKYPQGSFSWRCKNPGNLRYAGQTGSIGSKAGFAVFPTYEKGFAALRRQIEIAVNGQSRVYKPTMSLLEFFKTYAPSSDNNHPETYAAFIAKKLGVGVDFKVGELKA